MALRQFSAGGLVGVLAVGLLGAACTPDPGPSPSPSPTLSAPPSASPSPSRFETAEEERQRVAFEAAEKSYRINFAEVARLSMSGGAEKPTALLKATAQGEYLDSAMQSLRTIRKNELKASSPGTIDWVRGAGFEPAELVLESCEDYRRAVLRDQNGEVFAPEGTRVYQQTITLRAVGGVWKLTTKDTTEVEGC